MLRNEQEGVQLLCFSEFIPTDAELADSGSQGADFQVTSTPVRYYSVLSCLGG